MTRKDQTLLQEAYTKMYKESFEMTPQQEHQYSILSDMGWEFDFNSKNGCIVLVRNDRGMDSTIRLASIILKPDGDVYRLKRDEDIDEVLQNL